MVGAVLSEQMLLVESPMTERLYVTSQTKRALILH